MVWCPGSLRIKTRWRADGPGLPLEFARISEDGRLTLVILPGSKEQGTYWALSECESLDGGRRNLRERERAKLTDIHVAVRGGPQMKGIDRDVAKSIEAWLALNDDVGAALWTGLGSNWRDNRGRDFTPADAVRYLQELEALSKRARSTYERAREYIVNSPPLVGTEVREAMRAQGWKDAKLPEFLFDGHQTP